MSTVYNPKMTRRESLKRMGSMTSVVMIGGIAVACEAPQPEAMTVDASSNWPGLDFAAINENGYGTDPNMISPTAPWPRTLNSAQLDQVAVKGKAQGTKIYECLGRVKDTSDDEKALVTKMNQAFHLYYDRKFVEAEATFHGVQELFQGIRGYEDAASKLLAERCSRYHAVPPGVDWNGTEVLSQKHF